MRFLEGKKVREFNYVPVPTSLGDRLMKTIVVVLLLLVAVGAQAKDEGFAASTPANYVRVLQVADAFLGL